MTPSNFLMILKLQNSYKQLPLLFGILCRYLGLDQTEQMKNDIFLGGREEEKEMRKEGNIKKKEIYSKVS